MPGFGRLHVLEGCYHGMGRMSSLSKARKLIPYFTISELGIASFEVEQILDVTQSGVSRLRSKGCQQSVVEGITLAGLEAMLLSH